MNALDSPLEALAFSYASFGFFTFVNNLWAWVAVLTAAVSFWRIRAAGCSKPSLPSPSNDRNLNGSQTEPLLEAMMSDSVHERPVEAFVPETAPGTSPVVGSGDVYVDGVTKGKFTVYYEDDRECERSEELTEAEENWEAKGGEGKSEWWESWEKLLRMRTGENGWYDYQDLTELNGNVVRLWDGGYGYGTFPKESRYSSSCVVW